MADYSVTYDQLDALLQGLDPNTADAPYEIEIATVTASFLTGGGDSPAYGSLRYVLCQNPSKYVSLTWGADALSVIERLSAQPSSEQIYFTAINFLWGATSLVSIDMSHFFSVGGLWMNSFAGCTSLKALDLSNLEIPNFSYLANGCTSLEYVNMTGLTSLYKSEGTFANCSSLREVNLAGCDNIENSRLMFFGCSNLTSITLPDMSKNMDVSGMFSGCSSLEEIHNWTVPVEADYGRVSGSEDIRCFAGCTSLEHIYTNDTPSQESSWHVWDIRKDTANNQSTVTVYKPDGTSNSVSVPSAGTSPMKVTDKVDELLFSPSEGIPAATIQKMLQTKAPITAKDALDPTKDNFALWAKDRSSARTNVTTDVIEAGNKLPPTSEAVRAAIGGSLPVGTVIYYYGLVAPSGWFICDGTDTTGTPDELSTHHPELYALLGNTNVLPDWRECCFVGVGQSANDYDATTNPAGIRSHDVYQLGEFKDDQFQQHTHSYERYDYRKDVKWSSSSRIWVNVTTASTGGASGRTGTTTHGKQVGLNIIIKG